MNVPPDIATFDCARPCPICDRHLELSAIETVPWAPRTSGERLVFRCGNCGVAQTQWRAVPLVSAIELRYPFWDRRLVELCVALPRNYLTSRGWTRVIPRRSLADVG